MPKAKTKATKADKIALRQELIVKLQAQRIARRERIDALDARIEEMKAAREELMQGWHEMQEEIDDNLTQIEELRG